MSGGDQTYDLEHYKRRESSSRDLAAKSGDAAVKRIHSEMADKYAELARNAAPAEVRIVIK